MLPSSKTRPVFAFGVHDTCLHHRLPLDDSPSVAAVGANAAATAAAAATTAAAVTEGSHPNQIKRVVGWVRPRGDTDKRSASRGEGGPVTGLGEMLAAWGASTKAPIARWKARHGRYFAHEDVNRKAQAAARAAGIRPDYKLTFWGCMVAGAVSRR